MTTIAKYTKTLLGAPLPVFSSMPMVRLDENAVVDCGCGQLNPVAEALVIVIGIFKPQRREITFQSVNTFSSSLPNPSTRKLERKAVVAGGEPWLASHSLHPTKKDDKDAASDAVDKPTHSLRGCKTHTSRRDNS